MVASCKEIEWSSGQLEPAPLDRREPGTVDWFEGGISRDIDCSGAGVTIVTATPSIRTEDDDGELTFGVVTYPTTTSYRIPYTIGPSETQRMYAIKVVVTTSDARTLTYWHSLPVVPTTFLHA